MSTDRYRLAAALRISAMGPEDGLGWADVAADALMPVIDRIANERAAAELLDMADLLMKAHDVGPARRLRNRAAALGVYRAKAHGQT